MKYPDVTENRSINGHIDAKSEPGQVIIQLVAPKLFGHVCRGRLECVWQTGHYHVVLHRHSEYNTRGNRAR